MYSSDSRFPYVITLLVFSTLIFSFVYLFNINVPRYGLAQSDGNLNQRSEDIINNPEGLMESMVSPGNLMDSVIDKVRNSSTSDTNIRDTEESLYSQGESLILSHQVIPAKDFLHLYDTYPFAISEGFVAVKLPCDVDNSTHLRVLVGQIPNLQPATLNLEEDLSKPGYMCLYNLDIQQNSTKKAEILAISDVVLFNAGDERIVLPNTSSFVIGISKMYPLQNVSLVETAD
jgi:hypothetical protein